MFAVLLRFFIASGARDLRGADPAFAILAILSMIAGNLLALLQNNVKRLLAYSSIAHLGYALVAFLAGGSLAIEAVSVYLVAYAISTLGAFGVVASLSAGEARTVAGAGEGVAGAGAGIERPGPTGPGITPDRRDADALDDYRGLFGVRP